MNSFRAAFALGLVICSACTPARETGSMTTAATATASSSAAIESPKNAEVGKLAPDFALSDVDGHPVRLADFRGKLVVLEWFNPQCPFVNKAHTVGSLKDTPAKQAAGGVVWLGVDSSAPGKQGYEPESIRAGVARYGISYPILRDVDGKVGHAYGATNTPHMYVIDKTGVLVYAGAIDNSPDAEGQSPMDGKLQNYIDSAIQDILANRPVKTSSTKAYGCSVKYGS